MSTLKVTNIESPSGGGVNAKIADINGGHLGNRNLIINGAMNIAQRGTSTTDEGYGTVDRFFIQRSGGTVTHTQTAITSGSPYDQGFRNVLRLTNTATDTGVNGHRNAFQYIEAQNLAQSGWNYTSSSSYVTLSFWVRSSVGQEFFGYLRTFDGTEQGYSFSTGSLSANTWTKVTKTIPGNSNITINNDTGAGLQVNISPFWGTNYTDSGNTPGSWAAFNSGSRTPVYTNTWANTTNATFDITGIQLEVGEIATAFEHRSYGDELARCQRYFQRISGGNDAFTYPSKGQGTSSVDATIPLCVPLRASPTLNSIDSRAFTDSSSFAASSSTTPTAIQFSANNPHLAINCGGFSGLTNNEVSVWGPKSNALEISAEL